MLPHFCIIFAFLLVGCANKSGVSNEQTLQIAYNLNNAEGNSDVYIMDLDGKNSHNISNRDGVDWVCHTQGSQLYVLSDIDTCSHCLYLYKTDSKGSQWKKINTNRVAKGAIGTHKNGDQIIYKPENTKNSFVIIDQNGGVLNIITPNLEISRDPSFSPEGNRIVFVGNSDKPNEFQSDELYLINVDGSNLVQLTNYNTDSTLQTIIATPKWNSTTNTISYSCGRKSDSRIFSIDPSSLAIKAISPPNVNAIHHDISVDGTKIVFDAQLSFKADKGRSYIFLSDNEKRNSTKLTNNNGMLLDPFFVIE